MTTFEFVSVLLSIVVSLAFTHLLTGVARLIQARRVRFSLLYAGWIGLFLFSCVDFWFSLWQARATETWSLGFVIFWLLLATMLYITAWLAIPGEIADGADLPAFHDSNRRRYAGAFFIYMGVGLVGNLMIASLQLAALLSLFLMMLIAGAWAWRDRRVQFAMLGLLYVAVGWYALNFIPEL